MAAADLREMSATHNDAVVRPWNRFEGVDHVPGRRARPPSGSTSEFVHTPLGADHRLVFSLLDPSFGNEGSALVDLAVAFKFSRSNGGPDTGGPCG